MAEITDCPRCGAMSLRGELCPKCKREDAQELERKIAKVKPDKQTGRKRSKRKKR